MRKIIGLIGLLLVLASCQKQEKTIYEIVFYDTENQIIETTTMAEGSPIVFINEDISKEGYALLGWETAENLRIYEGDLVTGDLALYPIYQANEYNISFYVDGGSEINDLTIDYDTIIDTLAYQTQKEGYDFCGWYMDSDQTISANNQTMPAHDVTLYAKWCPSEHVIHFHYASGEVVTQTFETFSLFTANHPIYVFYTFEGWYEEGEEVAFDFSVMPNRDVDVYERRVEVVYEIEWVTGNTYEIPNTIYQLGSPDLDLHIGEVYQNKELMGWYFDPQFQEPFQGGIPSNQTYLRLYALWSPAYLSMHQPASEDVYHASLRDLLYEGVIEIPEIFRGLPVTVIKDFKDGHMREVVIPKTVEIIDHQCFMDTLNLVTVTFDSESKLESIGDAAFYNSHIRYIDLPDQVLKIGYHAFYLSELLGLLIPESVINLDSPFNSVYQTIYFESENYPAIYMNRHQNREVFGYDDVIMSDALYGVLKDEKVTIISSKDPSLAALMMPSDINGFVVDTIGQYAFANSDVIGVYCSELCQITTIEDYAFDSATSLQEFDLPQGLITIGARAFYRTRLSDILIPATVIKIGQAAFSSIDYPLISIVFEEGINLKIIEDYTFNHIKGTVSDIIIPKSVEEIGYSAFAGTNMNSLSFEEDSVLKIIGDEAFMNSDVITNVTLPDGLTDLGMYAFSMCDSLVNIYIPSSILNIKTGAFLGSETNVHIALYGPLPGFEDGWYNELQTVIYLTD